MKEILGEIQVILDKMEKQMLRDYELMQKQLEMINENLLKIK